MSQKEVMLQLLKSRPYLVNMGSGLISKRYNLPIEIIRDAKATYRAERFSNNVLPHMPKILVLDIETAPMKAYVWSRWKQNIYLEQTISEWFMICWSAKWFGEKGRIFSDVLTPEEAKSEDDRRIVESLWRMLNEADIVVAHNGKKFDIPKMNARFVIHGLPPTSPYKQIDTKEVAAKQFGFSSNKLDALATYFGIPNKDETDFGLWVKCLEGDPKALLYMEKYNRKDVLILESVYRVLRPWIKNHPNAGLFIENKNKVCPVCGSKDVKEDNSYMTTTASKFKVYRCTKCGALSRERENHYPKVKRSNLLRSV